jgi:hypothetical protein
MAPIFPFSILTYSFNPIFLQPGQIINVGPSPGFSAQSYSISGTLPAGLSFSESTGRITGTATTLTPAVTLQVTATLVNSTTSTCNVIISVVDTPVPAVQANTNSAIARTNNVLLAEQNFLNCAEQMINNNGALGRFSCTFDLQELVSFRWVYFYFSRLNYTVENLTPNNDDLGFQSYFGALPSWPGPWEGPYGPWFDGYPYPDFGQNFPATVASHPVRKVRISWSQWTGYCQFPYAPWPVPPFYGPN